MLLAAADFDVPQFALFFLLPGDRDVEHAVFISCFCIGTDDFDRQMQSFFKAHTGAFFEKIVVILRGLFLAAFAAGLDTDQIASRFMSKVFGGWFLGKFLKKIKRSFKRSISKNSFLDYLGLKYVGLFDGHDLKTLIKVLKDIKENKNPTLLHVKTIKGKGYTLAEENSTKFHGVGKNLKYNNNYFSNQVSDILEDLYKDNDKIVAITAGMEDGTGLSKFAKLHPKAFVDVGIQEEFAVTLSAGMAISGTKPIVFIYSTFLQRSYDQIISDVCLQNLPVIFCIDRAGFVGSDGKTHQGLFDVSYLSHIPNLTILSPKDVTELRDMLKLALSLNSPVAIRYPNGEGYEFETKSQIDNSFKWETICEGEKNVIFAVGPRMLNLALEVSKNAPNPVTVVNARCIKPLCSETLNKYANYRIITLEENTEIGGFGSQVLKYYNDNNLKVDVKIFGVKDCFIEHATIKRQMELNGFTVDNIIKNLL